MTETAARLRQLVRFLPLILLAAGLVLAFFSGLYRYLSFDTLQEQRETLGHLIAERPAAMIVGYVLIYALITAFMVPGALWLTIAGGFLFGLTGAVLATVCGATTGAIILFLAARTSFGEGLRNRAGPFLAGLRTGFEENARSVMFAMRFMPAVPFPVANIAPALLGARLSDFVLTTAIGIIPGAAAYAWIGAGLGTSLDEGRRPDLAGFAANLAPAFLLLACVSLVPIAVKYVMRRRTSKQSQDKAGEEQ